MERNWLMEKWRWTMDSNVLQPPTAYKWGSNVTNDLVCSYTHTAFIDHENRDCSKCVLQRKQAGKRVKMPHYQSPYLPKSWVFMNENLARKFQFMPQYEGPAQHHWWLFPKDVQLRGPHFFSPNAGILMTPCEHYLESLQTVYDMRHILEQVSL